MLYIYIYSFLSLHHNPHNMTVRAAHHLPDDTLIMSRLGYAAILFLYDLSREKC